jgi:ABC-type bacteriocin/lantibiotic exporter with double-glycine peptidase domain
MTNHLISRIIQEFSTLIGHEYPQEKAGLSFDQRNYRIEGVNDFIHDLIEESSKVQLVFLQNVVQEEGLPKFLSSLQFPVLFFSKKDNDIVPIIINPKKYGKLNFIQVQENDIDYLHELSELVPTLVRNEEGKVVFLTGFSYRSLVSESEDGQEARKLGPVERLFRLLGEEKTDITYIYIYAVIVGLISLSLPLGIQAIIGMISGGMMFSSVIVLISLVILGIIVAGGLQIMQITLVEHLQRRVFAKTAFEFAFRIPRIKMESVLGHHAPELMNRFFDILTIQKGLPKLLIDMSAAALQIIFGLILLAFYHPFFIVFGLFLLLILGAIFYLTGPKGLKTSIKESKYKYKVAFWLEEMARTINSFKMAGTTHLPIQKTDHNVSNYLINRRAHFKVLIIQFINMLAFKTLVTGGLLILGTILVIDRQITLGQFVASEIIVILILYSVEKIIFSIDVVYDLLTSVDKISHVTDLPLERPSGIIIPHHYFEEGVHLRLKDVKYKYPDAKNFTLNGIDLEIKPKEKVVIAGYSDAGKSTLLRLMAGLYNNYEGILTYNNISLREVDYHSLRNYLSKNISQEDIFDGTILENLTIGKPFATYKEVLDAIEAVGLSDIINNLPNGLNTEILSGGRPFPTNVVNKLILARCITKNPRLLLINDLFTSFEKKDKERLVNLLFKQENPWTLVVLSNDPQIMKSCDRVILLKQGKVYQEGTFDELNKNQYLQDIIKV